MFKTILSPIEQDFNLFEKQLKNIIASQNNFLKNDLENFMFSNAKRLRVIFILLFSKILKLNCDNVYRIALISEIIHSASLIHDDIIDEEDLRRNQKTFHSKYNSKLAVLEGDLLLSLALNILSDTSLEISKIFSKKILATINGEINQNENLGTIISIEQYLEKTFDKTANLFLAGLESLFTLNEFSDDLKINLSEFMKNYAIAFQIKNDIDNIKTNKTDIKNGNYTLSVLYFFMENEQKQNCVVLDKYINKALLKVNEFKNLAISHLNKIPDSIYKNALLELCSTTLRS